MKTMNIDIITKYLAGETNPEEKDTFREWLQSHPDNQEEFNQLEKLWNAVDSSRNYRPEYISASYAKVKNRIHDNTKKNTGYFFYLKWIAVAALIILSIGLTYVITVKQTFIYQSGGQKKEFTLPDNSTVILNKNTELKYIHKTFGKRESSLNGEAYFNIINKSNRPFFITTGNTEITVVGTSFYVSAYRAAENTKVQVKSGIVKVSNKNEGSHIILKKGESGEVDHIKNTIQKFSGYDENSLVWNTGRLVFKNTCLKEVFSVLENTYDLKIVVKNIDIERLRFTGIFENTTLPVILETLSNTFQIKILNNLESKEVIFY